MSQGQRRIVEVIVRDDADGDRFVDEIMQLPLRNCMVYVRRVHGSESSAPTLGDADAMRVPSVIVDGEPVGERDGRLTQVEIEQAVTAPRRQAWPVLVDASNEIGPN